MFADETPTLNRKRWETILDLLIERDLGTRIIETFEASVRVIPPVNSLGQR
jgi:hypothetical protein